MSYTKHAPAAHPQSALIEAAGLRWLKVAESNGGPAIVDVLDAKPGVLQLAEIHTAGPTAEASWRLGDALAKMHRSLSPGTAFGSLPPEHPATESPLFGPAEHPLAVGANEHTQWGRFYADERLAPVFQRLKPTTSSADWDLLESARATIRTGAFDLDEPASLIHGDLWAGNVLFTSQGAVLIDPAAHAGHRESDMAMLKLFGLPYLDQLLESYQQTAPLTAGWQDRVPVHQLFYLAVHWLLFGAGYRGATLAAAETAATTG